jgi:DNA-binding NarL/FixJ family response regulator
MSAHLETEYAASGKGIAAMLPTRQPSGSSLERIRVLLVDDHTMVRQTLHSLLDLYANIEVVGEACNGEEAVTMATALSPTVILMDINMPKMNGIKATAIIKANCPDIIVIGLSVHSEGGREQAMTEAGATVLLNKEAAFEELYEAIERVLTHEKQSQFLH